MDIFIILIGMMISQLYVHMSELIRSNILNVYSLLHTSYTSIKTVAILTL